MIKIANITIVFSWNIFNHDLHFLLTSNITITFVFERLSADHRVLTRRCHATETHPCVRCPSYNQYCRPLIPLVAPERARSSGARALWRWQGGTLSRPSPCRHSRGSPRRRQRRLGASVLCHPLRRKHRVFQASVPVGTPTAPKRFAGRGEACRYWRQPRYPAG